MTQREVVLGPPGTGKTTYLLSEVEKALASGTPGWAIGYFAFTKKAASEAVDRAVRKFKLYYKDLPYFRTLHSLAFQQLSLGIGQVMSKDHFQELGRHLGMQICAYMNLEDGTMAAQTKDDRLVFAENLARVRCVDLREVWMDQNDDISWRELDRYARGLAEFKRIRGLTDYTDMLYRFIERGKAPKLQLLVIDEAQDLSELQWRMVELLAQNAERVLIAGDDDQCIYRWAGASVKRFLNLSGKVTVLDQSYRIPSEVHAFAARISEKIKSRRPKDFKPRVEAGTVTYHPDTTRIDLSSGQWLVLARNRYLLQDIQETCEAEGFNYMATGVRAVEAELCRAISAWENRRKAPKTYEVADEVIENIERYAKKKDIVEKRLLPWHEAFTKMTPARRERVLSMVQRGEDITKEPRIKLSTIHGAKGGEADNVIVLTDMSYKSYQEMMKNPDDELRVLYVAVTRAKENLHVVEPQSDFHFRF